MCFEKEYKHSVGEMRSSSKYKHFIYSFFLYQFLQNVVVVALAPEKEEKMSVSRSSFKSASI